MSMEGKGFCVDWWAANLIAGVSPCSLSKMSPLVCCTGTMHLSPLAILPPALTWVDKHSHIVSALEVLCASTFMSNSLSQRSKRAVSASTVKSYELSCSMSHQLPMLADGVPLESSTGPWQEHSRILRAFIGAFVCGTVSNLQAGTRRDSNLELRQGESYMEI